MSQHVLLLRSRHPVDDRLLLLFLGDLARGAGLIEFLEHAEPPPGRASPARINSASEITPFTGWSGSVTMNGSRPIRQPSGFGVTTKSYGASGPSGRRRAIRSGPPSIGEISRCRLRTTPNWTTPDDRS